MQFFKALIRNLIIILVVGVGLLILFPEIMRQVFQIYGAVLGLPIIILVVVVAALPRKR